MCRTYVFIFLRNFVFCAAKLFSNSTLRLGTSTTQQVMNLYCLVELSHLKTVAVMDVLEGVVFLGESHSRGILGLPKTESFAANSKRSHGHSKSKDLSTDRNHVIALAGETGIIRLFRLQVNVKNSTFVYSLLKVSNFVANFSLTFNGL